MHTYLQTYTPTDIHTYMVISVDNVPRREYEKSGAHLKLSRQRLLRHVKTHTPVPSENAPPPPPPPVNKSPGNRSHIHFSSLKIPPVIFPPRNDFETILG